MLYYIFQVQNHELYDGIEIQLLYFFRQIGPLDLFKLNRFIFPLLPSNNAGKLRNNISLCL